MTTFPAAGTVAAVSTTVGAGQMLAVAGGRVDVVGQVSAQAPARRRPGALDLIGPAMEAFLVEAAAALDPPAGRVSLYSGAQVAWDECCDGQVWVRLVGLVPGNGSRDQSQQCGVMWWTATFGIGVLRCAVTVDDNGGAPSPAELISETLQMTADEAAIQQAIQCGIAPLVDRLMFTRWDPLGPEGGCVGGEWQFTVKIGN